MPRVRGISASSLGALGALVLGLLVVVQAPAQADEPPLTSAAAGGRHSCALRGGQVWCWGENDRGQLGAATPSERSDVPVRVNGISTAVDVTAGAAFSCALLADGTARCWGAGNTGQLGNGASEDSHVPVEVTGLTGLEQISAGRAHACAMNGDLTVFCWGSNGAGQLVTGSVNDADFYMNTMTQPQQAAGANSLAVAQDGTFVVADQSGYLWKFGDRGTNINRYAAIVGSQPKPVAVVGGVTYYAVGTALGRITPTGGWQYLREFPGPVVGLAGDDLAGGHLYVSYGGTRVAKFSVSNLTTAQWNVPVPVPDGQGLTPPTSGGDIAFGINPNNPNAGNLFLTYTNTDAVRAVSRLDSGTGELLTSFLPFPPGGTPCAPTLVGLAGGARVGTDADGNVWVSGQGAGARQGGGYCVDAFTPSGNYVTSWRDPLLNADYAFDVAGLADGSVLIVDAQYQRVLRAVPGDDFYETDHGWGDVPFSLSPRRAVPLSSFHTALNRVEAGGDHTCFWRAKDPNSGSFMACAGDNSAGEIDAGLGQSSTSFPSVFTGFATQASSVGVGAHHICATNDARSAATCRGANAHGQTGGGNLQISLAGVPQSIVDLELGRTSTCALLTTGQVYCLGELPVLGDGCYAQTLLGNSCTRSPVRSLDGSAAAGVPQGVISGATSVSVSGDGGCLTFLNTSVHCWNRPDDVGETGLAAQLDFPPVSRATVTPGEGVLGPVVVGFPEDVGSVTAANLLVREAGGEPVPTTRACRNSQDASTSCSGDTVRSVWLTPVEPLVPGRGYVVVINPVGAAPVTGADGPLGTDSVSFSGPASQQEDGSAVGYTWASTSTTKAKAYGKSYEWSNTPGSTLSTTFRGRSVTWYGHTGPDGGKVRVLVDGKSKATLSLKAATDTWKVPFRLGRLGGGVHTLTLSVLATRPTAPEVAGRVSLDAIKVGRKLTPSPRTTATWGTRSDPGASGGAYAVSYTPGSAVTFTFDGGGLTWSTLLAPTLGLARVVVDGVDQGVVDVAGIPAGFRDVPIPLASPGPHQVRLVVQETAGGDSAGPGVVVDAFVAEEN